MLIGRIMLIGIAVKNSLLVVDYAVDAMRLHGMPRHEALMDACHKRARPVVMTTRAMIAGMLPIALLVVVPAAFTLIEDVERWLFRRRAPRPGEMAGAEVVEG